jgi:hypothetical protein
MSLLEELKKRHDERREELKAVEDREEKLCRELNDLDTAIAALEQTVVEAEDVRGILPTSTAAEMDSCSQGAGETSASVLPSSPERAEQDARLSHYFDGRSARILCLTQQGAWGLNEGVERDEWLRGWVDQDALMNRPRVERDQQDPPAQGSIQQEGGGGELLLKPGECAVGVRSYNEVQNTWLNRWLVHDGGPCPLSGGERVIIKYRNGFSSGELEGAVARDHHVWRHGIPFQRDVEVVAYQIIADSPEASGTPAAETEAGGETPQLVFNDVSALDDIAIRVQRDGKFVSAFVGELSYVTRAELEDMAAGNSILNLILRSPTWAFDAFEGVYINLARKPNPEANAAMAESEHDIIDLSGEAMLQAKKEA